MINPLVVEHPAPGIVRERSSDGHLVIFNVSDGSTETIQQWSALVKLTLEHWLDDQPCRLMHDFHRCRLDAYDFLPSFDDLFRLRPNLARQVAVVMPGESSANALRHAVQIREASAPHRVHWEIFSRRREALHWILQHCL